MAACYPGFELPAARHKDYSRPLHVDCSVEYELPNQAKPPEGARSEPLLMIHPCYYRRAESQRRSPFINNLPRPGASASVGRRVGTAASAGAVAAVPPQQSGASRLLPPPWATAAPKRDPLLCGDLTSTSADSGHWTDTERSPADARLHRDFAPDSGIATPVSLADDKAVLSELLAATCGADLASLAPTKDRHLAPPVSRQPAVAVAAVSCRGCMLPSATSTNATTTMSGAAPAAYQRLLQQPWAVGGGGSVTPAAPAVAAAGKLRATSRAVEPGPLHAARRSAAAPWGTRVTKRSSLRQQQAAPPTGPQLPECKECDQWGSYYGPCRGASEDSSRILWNNESMLRLFQV